MVSVIVFSLAVALLILHFVDRRVPIGYVLAAFIMASMVAAGDIREPAGQICVTTTSTVTTTTGNTTVTQTYPAEVCTTHYTLRFESLAALIASVAFTMLTLVIYVLERLAGRAGGGWTT
jgi:hypothetical protein